MDHTNQIPSLTAYDYSGYIISAWAKTRIYERLHVSWYCLQAGPAMQRAINAIQITTITAPAILLTGFPFLNLAWACARQSANTEAGINLIANAIPTGIRIRSSR